MKIIEVFFIKVFHESTVMRPSTTRVSRARRTYAASPSRLARTNMRYELIKVESARRVVVNDCASFAVSLSFLFFSQQPRYEVRLFAFVVSLSN